jgi:hypothetical protein
MKLNIIRELQIKVRMKITSHPLLQLLFLKGKEKKR